ncbi:LCP family protein [Phycicoccus endophyticus]|uniref:LCP family protein n=1 Tax=Phycicoccus endophyticus TaxID=1690220 RepID=A0A7G9R314_9MICO|nr:LCP family protein [Phycicoccus endophyticus]NHI20284.1 LCP family protein [Phycicoccus endophyticus]QNN49989.1 LCP family protein [Phycicoccus endophyticus]GGL29018.1 hypothetical protein GCM10012283_09130 [Phycicoccus endophyticus]
MSEDEQPRPIPQRGRSDSSDDVYVVDTRRRRAAGTRRPGAATSPSGSGARSAGPRAATATPAAAGETAYDEYGRPVPPAAARTPRPTGRRRRRPRAWVVLVVVLVGWLAFTAVAPWHAWSTVSREDTTPSGDRPAAGDGHTYLLVGSDSRQGLTAQQKKRLGTGSAAGRRTDSIILVHVPSGSGKAALISIPRDSYLPIPGYGSNKVNASFAFGGPKLLVQTLEQATGLRLDGYVEIGFGGFANVVDSLGGVDLCIPRNIKDKLAHLNVKKGCQTLDGPTALGYVRARYSDPKGDLGRAERQRQFLGAVMSKAATPSTVLVPWRWWGFTHSAASSVVVGEDTSLLDAYRILSTMRSVSSGDTLSLVVPVSDVNATTSAGSSVLWDDERAANLFTMLREGTPLEKAPAGTDGVPSGG